MDSLDTPKGTKSLNPNTRQYFDCIDLLTIVRVKKQDAPYRLLRY